MSRWLKDRRFSCTAKPALKPDGDESLASFAYTWRQVSGSPVVVLAGADTKTPTFIHPMSVQAAHLVWWRARFRTARQRRLPPGCSGAGFHLRQRDDRVTVRITNVNNAPAANAGSDQTVDENAPKSLSAADSSDPDSDSLTYAWSQVAGPSVSLSSATTGAPEFIAPYVASGGADLTFHLTVDDGYGGLSSDTVVVHVQT